MKASPFLAAVVLNSTIVGLLLAQTPSQSPSQSKPGEDEVVRVSTNLVQVDAVVTDKDGKQVTDLRAEDFEILEDNHPQQISAFAYVSTDSSMAGSAAQPVPATPIKNAPPLPSAAPRPDQVRRTIVFVVDDLALSLQSFNAVRSGLKKFVDELMRPDDLVAVIRTGGGAAALQRLTRDKRQLYAAIENVHWRGFLNRASVRNFDENTLGPAESARSLRGTIMALKNIVASLKVLPGRKSVLFFSDRFETTTNPGDLKIGAAKAPKPGDAAVADSAERDTTDYSDIIGGLVRASAQASVVIYTVDARGLVYNGPMAADSSPTGNIVSGDPGTQLISGAWISGMLDERSATLLATQQSLRELAHQTGGIAVINNNDIGKGIGRIMGDMKGYYLIGYRPSDTTFAKRNGRVPYHAITLKLKRPGFHIRSRTGFYGVPDETRPAAGPRSRAEQLVASLESPFAAGEVRLRLTTLFGNVPQTSFVRTLLHIDVRDLTFKDQPDGWHQADFDVLASSYGENGLIADYLARSETIRARGRTYANLLRYGLNYNLLVPIKKPGPYQLRAAVRDSATDRVGSAYQFIEVPELKKGRLALSGIAISSAVLDLASLSSGSAVYNAAAQEGESAQPTPAVRRFKAGTLMDYGYVVYNALPGHGNTLPDLKAEVRLFHEGELVASQAEQAIDTSRLQTDLTRLSSKGRLRLSDQLIPGQYVLQIVVTDPQAKEKYATASQWIDFEIVK